VRDIFGGTGDRPCAPLDDLEPSETKESHNGSQEEIEEESQEEGLI
jgi:hypothetical protein